MKVFITGRPGVGKSTVLTKVQRMLEDRGFSVGGVSCPEMRKGGARTGFRIIDVGSGRTGVLSDAQGGIGPKVGKYVVNLRDLEVIGVQALDNAARDADVVLIDEVGPMEMHSRDFQDAVLRLLDSPKSVVGILHWQMKHQVVSNIMARNDVEVFELTLENRSRLPVKIVDMFVKEVTKSP